MQNDNQLSESARQRKGRIVLILMLIFFVVPIIVVIVMYKLNWMPTGTSVGDLVRPPRLLSAAGELKSDQGVVLPSTFWKDKWSIVYVAGDCQKACLNKLHDMRQLHVSLYKDMQRAQRVLITTTQDTTVIKHDYPDMIVINQPADNVLNFAQQFQIDSENVTLSDRLYLVDPLGHLMMSYQHKAPLADVRKDITRLLRYSWAG